MSFFHLGSLVATALWVVLIQQPHGSFEALQETLGLSDTQVTELQQNHPRLADRGPVIYFPEGMDEAHRARLSGIAKVLEREGTAAMAIEIGLIRQEQWLGGPN